MKEEGFDLAAFSFGTILTSAGSKFHTYGPAVEKVLPPEHKSLALTFGGSVLPV